MKKIVTYLSLIATVFLLGSTNVYAEEQTSSFIDISKLCILKENNKLAVKFDLSKDIDLTNRNAVININVRNINNQSFGGTCMNGTCESDGMVIVPSTTTCSTEKVNGTEIYEKKLTNGTTIAQYYEMFNEESFIASDIIVEILLKDENYDYENITYNIKEGKIEQIEKGHDAISELLDLIPQKYPNWETYMGGGDEDAFSMTFRNIEIKEVDILKTITITNWQQKTLEEMLKEVAPVFENKEVKLEVSDKGMTNTTLEDIKQNGYLASVEKYSEDGEPKLLYTWTFDGSKIKDTNLNVDLTLNVGKSANQEKIETLVPTNKKSLVLEFTYHGILPEGTSVKVNVLDKFQNGKKVALYYYNEGKLEKVAKNLEVKDGFVEFALEHCSDYVLVEENNNAQTGTLNIVLYSGLAITSLLGIGYLLISKKKNM